MAWFDRHVVDATMDGIAWITNAVSFRIKGLQSGQVQQYAFVFVSSAILLGILFIYLFACERNIDCLPLNFSEWQNRMAVTKISPVLIYFQERNQLMRKMNPSK